MNKQQSGIVSITVTMIMLIVISLIVLGFAQVSRSEQRQSIDRHLSQQAFLAAESGVNDARNIALKAVATNNQVVEKDSCAPTLDYPASVANPDLGDEISYTCLLVSTRMTTLVVDPLSSDASSVNLPIEPASGQISSLRINWNASAKPKTSGEIASKCPAKSANGYFSSNNGDWTCPYGVLRLDIVATDAINRAALQASQRTVFLYPVAGAGSLITYGSLNGTVASTSCIVASGCTINIGGFTPATGTKYAIRMTAIYKSGSVGISAYQAATRLELKNAQVVIDATGKAKDVLRRIQVRIPIDPAGDNPDYAIQSGSSICKRFEIGNLGFKIPSDFSGANQQDLKNPMCRPINVTTP